MVLQRLNLKTSIFKTHQSDYVNEYFNGNIFSPLLFVVLLYGIFASSNACMLNQLFHIILEYKEREFKSVSILQIVAQMRTPHSVYEGRNIAEHPNNANQRKSFCQRWVPGGVSWSWFHCSELPVGFDIKENCNESWKETTYHIFVLSILLCVDSIDLTLNCVAKRPWR